MLGETLDLIHIRQELESKSLFSVGAIEQDLLGWLDTVSRKQTVLDILGIIFLDGVVGLFPSRSLGHLTDRYKALVARNFGVEGKNVDFCNIVNVDGDTGDWHRILLAQDNTESNSIRTLDEVFLVGDQFAFADNESWMDIDDVKMWLFLGHELLRCVEGNRLGCTICLEIVGVRSCRIWCSAVF